MHAYKDAIKQSAGSYVLYPGLDHSKQLYIAYHEILPGLGAFPLRPTDTGAAEGTDSLQEFLSQVLDHVATQHTQHERNRYWTEEAHRQPPVLEPAPAAPFVTRPPADTPVLLGFVKSKAHRHWIHEQKLYNVRADGRRGAVEERSPVLGAQLLLLYSNTLDFVEVWSVKSGPHTVTRTEMAERDYPNPGGDIYHCFVLQPVDAVAWSVELTAASIMNVKQQVAPSAEYGAPVAATWEDIIRFRAP